MNNLRSGIRNPKTIVAASILTYLAGYLVLRPLFGVTASALISLPVVAITWLYGLRLGLVGLVGIIVFDLACLFTTGDASPQDTAFWYWTLFGAAILLIITVALGTLRELNQRLTRERDKRLEVQRSEQQRSAELEALARASVQVTANLELKPVLTTIVEQGVALLKPDEIHIYLYDGTDLTFGAAYWEGQPQQTPLRVPRAEGFTEMVARTGQRKVIPDLRQDEIYRIRNWTGAVMGVPLSVGAKVYGVMNVGYAQPHDFGANELNIIQLLANQAAIAIRNAREYELTRDHAAELEVRVAERTAELMRAKEAAEALVLGQRKVLALAYELVSSPDIDDLWKRAVEMARSVLGVERCSIFIERDNYMHGTYGTNLNGETTDEHHHRFFKGERSWENLESVLSLDMPTWGVEYNPHQEWDGEKWVDLPSGWVAVSPIHSAYRFIGIFYNDTAISGAPINEVQQEILSMYCSFLGSLYEHKRVEDEVRRALEREKELSELKSRFTSMISHELRTPLSTIQLSGDLLKRYSFRLSEEAINTHIDKIQAQVTHLTSLLEDVLTFTRGEGVGLQLQLKLIDLKAFCAQLATEVGLTHTTHQIIFEDCAGTWMGSVDPKLLRQALLNLLFNAVKYSPPQSRVTLSLERDGDEVIIRVADEGIGIPEADIPRIFDVFYRARNVGAVSGTGLGLALVHQIIEAHHGVIVCESQLNTGTTFILRIPAF